MLNKKSKVILLCLSWLVLSSWQSIATPPPSCYTTNVAGTTIERSSCIGALVIPEGIEIIAENAFKDSLITSIKLPNSLSRIENAAFYNTPELISVEFGIGLNYIGSLAFRSPDGTSKIESFRFQGNAPGKVFDTFPDVSPRIPAVINNSATGFGEFGATWNNLIVKPLPPAFNISNPSGVATVGTAIDTLYEVVSTGGAIAGFSIDPALPEGLSLSGSGTITGTPTIPLSATLFEITATNLSGSAKRNFSLTVNATVPGSITSHLIQAGHKQIKIEFTAPSTGGSPITNYKYSIDGGATFQLLSPAQTSSPVYIQGLTNGTSYNVSLKAVNAIGDGPAITSDGPHTPTSCLEVDGTIITSGASCFGDLVIDEGPTIIATNAFMNNDRLSSISIPNTLISIEETAFMYTPNLRRIRFSSGLEEIAGSAFWGCGLTEVDIPNSVTTLSGITIFQDCISLTRATIGNGLSAIKSGMFYNTGLTEVIIGDKVTMIESNAFGSTTNLSSITFRGNSPVDVDATAFSGISASARVYVGESATGFPTGASTPRYGELWNGMIISRLSPTFTLSASSETATAGTAINGFSISSTGGAISSYSINPAVSNNLSFNTSTGLISGIPDSSSSAITYEITGTNETGSFTRSFVLTVNPKVQPVIYVPPKPIPFLVSKSPPKVSFVNDTLICTAGLFEYGTTLEGIKQSRSTYSPTSITFTLFRNGLPILETTSSQSQTKWNIDNAEDRDLISCGTQVVYAGITLANSSLENNANLITLDNLRQRSIALAEKRYQDELQDLAKQRVFNLEKNKIDWRQKVKESSTSYELQMMANKKIANSRDRGKVNLSALKNRIENVRKVTAEYKENGRAIEVLYSNDIKLSGREKDKSIVASWRDYSDSLLASGYGLLIVRPWVENA